MNETRVGRRQNCQFFEKFLKPSWQVRHHLFCFEWSVAAPRKASVGTLCRRQCFTCLPGLDLCAVGKWDQPAPHPAVPGGRQGGLGLRGHVGGSRALGSRRGAQIYSKSFSRRALWVDYFLEPE